MAKKDWGKPAYKGSVDPLSSANYFMAILVFILLLGFIQAGLKKGWFETIVNTIMG